MAFTLHSYFAGLNLFTPNARHTEMTCMMLDVSRPYWSSTGQRIPRHTAAMVYDRRQLHHAAKTAPQAADTDLSLKELLAHEAPAGLPTENVAATRQIGLAPPMAPQHQVPEELRHLAFWRLDEEDVAIRPGNEPAPRHRLQVVYDRRIYNPDGTPKNMLPDFSAGEERDFSWVIDIRDLSREIGVQRATADPDIVSESPQLNLVASRVALTVGELSTKRLVGNKDGIYAYEFRSLGEPDTRVGQRQAVAEIAECQTVIDADSVTLTATPFGGGAQRSIELAPSNAADPHVHIGFMNYPLHEGCCEDGVGINDLELYYELLRTRPPIRRRPVAHRMAQKVTQGPEQPTPPILDWMYERKWVTGDLQHRSQLDICPLGQGPGGGD